MHTIILSNCKKKIETRKLSLNFEREGELPKLKCVNC